jgi:hypothetical protein
MRASGRVVPMAWVQESEQCFTDKFPIARRPYSVLTLMLRKRTSSPWSCSRMRPRGASP